MGFFDSALKLGGKAATLGGKVFGLGKGRLSFRDKKLAGMGWSKTVKGNPWGATGQTAAKIAAIGTGTNLLQNAIGDAGPEGDEFMERAYNQIRYGVDMTDAQMEEAAKGGMEFQDTGLIGEGGLNEEQVLKYIEQEAQDKRGGWEKAASAGLSGLAMVPGLSTILGTPAEMLYDKAVGDTRRLGLKNVVESLKLDANTIKMRKDAEKKQGKFMAQGLLGKDFGTGNVSGISRGGVKPPVDREAIAEKAAALKEYEAIKERDGVFAALAHPSALKAGRQVYLDVQEASDGDKNTAEALLSGVGGQKGVGLTDQETMERYYGNPEKNAAANDALAAAAKQTAAEAAAKQTAATAATSPDVKAQERSGQIDITPARTADEVRANQATIATQKGFHGQSPISVEQTAYLNAHGIKSSRQLNESMNEDPWKALFARHQKQSWDNQQAARNYIAPQHRMGVDPNGDAARAAQAAKVFGGPNPVNSEGKPLNTATPATAPLPAQVNQSANTPGIPSNIAPPRPNPGLIPPTVRPTVPPATAPTAMSPTPYGIGTANRGSGLPSFSPPRLPSNVMKPTPYGLGTATPGMPQVPNIGAPVRNAVENALTRRSSGPANVMAPTPYGLGTATPGVPQVPDIGAPVRNAVEGLLTQKSSPPGVVPNNTPAYDAKGNLTDPKIAMMIAEQKRKEIEARNKANPRGPNPRPTPRFYHPTQGPNNRPY